MKTIEQILQQLQAHDDYFTVRYDAEEDDYGERDIMKPCIGVLFRFHNGHKMSVRKVMPTIVKAYMDAYGQHLTGGYMLTNDGQKVIGKKYNDKLIERCLSEKSWDDPSDEKSLYLGSKDLEATTGYSFRIRLQSHFWESQLLSNIEMKISILHLNDLEIFKHFIELVCTLIPLHSAKAGFSTVLPEQFFCYETHQVPIAYRFYGCDIENTLNPALNKEPAGITGINWITIIGQQFINQMGGDDVVLNRVSEAGLQGKKVGDNLMVQAGEYPDLCDCEDLPINPYYLVANNLFKPIRKETVLSLHMSSASGEPKLGRAASDEWLRRYDRFPLPTLEPVSKEVTPKVEVTPPPSRYTGYKVAVGEVCQETGYYECPRLKGRTVMLMQGQPVAGDKHNEMGAIIWYKLTKEAERYYLDNRKKDPFTGNWE